MAPPASHITVNPYQEVYLPHGTHMTPLYLGENRAQHKTQTGGRPLQPCWLPVSLPAAACLQLPQVTASRCLSPARQVCPSFTRGSALLTRFPGRLPSLSAPPPLSTSWLRPVGRELDHGGGCKPDSGLARLGKASTSAAAKRRLTLRLGHNPAHTGQPKPPDTYQETPPRILRLCSDPRRRPLDRQPTQADCRCPGWPPLEGRRCTLH